MSVNVSLVESDTPGVSLYFDGQNVGDLQEAELQREEERQAKELRHLLETELEDFEEDFLSGSNSEDEGMASFNDSRDSGKPKYGSSLRQRTGATPSDSPHLKFQAILAGFSKSDQITQSQGSERHQARQDDPTSLDSSTQGGATAEKFDALLYTLTSADLSRQLQAFKSPASDHRQENYFSGKAANHRGTDSNHNNVVAGQGHTAADSDVSDLFLGLPSSSHSRQNAAPAAQNQHWTESYASERYQHFSFPNNLATPGSSNQAPTSLGRETSRPHFVPAVAGQNGGIAARSVSGGKTEDEWMMQIKNPQMSTFPHSDLKAHPHFQYPQGQQWPVTDLGNNGLKNISALGAGRKVSTPPTLEQGFATNADMLPTPHKPTRVLLPPPQSILPVSSAPALSGLPSTAHHSHPVGASREDQGRLQATQEVVDGGDGQFRQQKVIYKKPGLDHVGEEQYYLDKENVDYFLKDGPEKQRTYEQLEILYRARGREIEEMTQVMREKEEERGKEIRNLKHKLSIASGETSAMEERLQQSQKLLQQAKADNTDYAGKIRALETQAGTLREAKEELIKKHQVAEATIENLSHHIEELQNCDSLSRARNDHESIVSSLTSRYQSELLAMNEKLSVCRAALEDKQEELARMKKELTETTRELEQARMSRGETINRLARSLEDSQGQCQALLEKSSSQEMTSLRVQLHQAVASKRISEDLCTTFQAEVKELKEQLSMLESASSLGVFGLSSHATRSSGHDDSMTDLGIRKTLNFDSPQPVARRDRTQTSDELVASLRSELEKCLYSNKQKRSELADKAGEVRSLRDEIEVAKDRICALEKACLEQKNRLQEADAVSGPGSGVRVVEARLRRDIEELNQEKDVLLRDIEDYKKRLQEVGDSEAKLAEINAELSQQIAQMVNDFDVDKRTALESCQRTMEEVSKMSFDKLRQEMEERFHSEKTMLAGQYAEKIHSLKQELTSTQSELDNVKSLYIHTCEESSGLEARLTDRFKEQLEEELGKMKDSLEAEKREWETFMRDGLEKEQTGLKESLRGAVKSEVRGERGAEVKVSQAKQACLEEQQQIWQAVVDKTKRELQEKHQKELEQERSSYELSLARLNEQIKLGQEAVSKRDKSGEDFKQELETQRRSLEQKHEVEMKDLAEKHNKDSAAVEKKLNDMFLRFSLAEDNTGPDLSPTGGCLNGADAVGKLSLLERFLNEKNIQLRGLEKMVAGLRESSGEARETLSGGKKKRELTCLGVDEGVARVGGEDGQAEGRFRKGGLTQTNLDSSLVGCFHDDEHAKQLELMLNNMKQKYEREVEELKQQQQKELEKAARTREDKFQAELRYFLKEKEDQCKTKLEKAAKQSEATAKLQLEDVLKKTEEKYKLEIERVVGERDMKVRVQSCKVTEETDRTGEQANKDGAQQEGGLEEMRDKMKREMRELDEKHLSEKSSLERKIDKMKEEWENEIVGLSLRHAGEERRVRERLKKEMDELKVEHERTVGSLQHELDLGKSELAATEKSLDSLKRENQADKLIAEQLKEEVEKLKVSVREAQGVTEELQERRAKWFQEAQEYINKEIKEGVEERVKEEREKGKEMLQTEKGDFEKTVQERVQKEVEMCKEKLEREKKEEARRKVEVEVENLKRKFVSELEARVMKEKSRLEEEVRLWKEEAKRRMEEERNTAVSVLQSDSERRLQEERRKVEEDMNEVKERDLRGIREEMEQEMRKRIQREREEWEKEKEEYDNHAVEERVSDWRERLQLEMEARTKACTERDQAVEVIKRREIIFCEDKQKLMAGLKKCQGDLEQMQTEQRALEEKYAEIDRRYKADMKEARRTRHQDLAKLRSKMEEEKEELASSFKVHVMNIQDEFDAALEKARGEAERGKAKLLEEAHRQMELVSLPAQPPGSCSGPILQLRDQYLEAVARIKADVITHVQNANQQAAATIKAEIQSQRLQAIETFTAKVKTQIRCALLGQVSEKIIAALEDSVDLLSQHLASSSNSTSLHFSNMEDNSAGSDWMPGNRKLCPKNCEKAQTKTGDVGPENRGATHTAQPALPACKQGRKNSDPIFEPPVLDKGGRRRASVEQLLPSSHHQPYQANFEPGRTLHPQLDNVDLFDSDIVQHSPSSSNNSSPAHRAHFRSELRSTATNHHVAMPDMPSLSPNISPRTRAASSKTRPDVDNDPAFGGVHSPRDDMKVMEARVRLANWAKSGEMPWKSSEKYRDADGFVKPGLEAEQWVRGQRTASSHKDIPASSDESDDASSTGTNISFLTLEPQAVENSGLKCLSLGTNGGRAQSSLRTNVDHPQSSLGTNVDRGTYLAGREKDNPRARISVPDGTPQSKGPGYGNGELYLNGSTSSPGRPPPHKQAQTYSAMTLPTSTPLGKLNKISEDLKPHSQGSGTSSKQWKTIGGTFLGPDREFNTELVPEQEQGNHLRPQTRSHSPQLSSKLRKRSRSAERNKDNLALKSVEFPSDLSRITQGSGSDQPQLWRYKSLEDLIPNLERPGPDREVMSDVRPDGMAERGRRTDKPGLKTSQERTVTQRNVDFFDRPGHLHAPVKAMTSKFWEQQNEDDTQETTRPSGQRQAGFSTFDCQSTTRIEGEIRPASKSSNENLRRARQHLAQSADYQGNFSAQTNGQTVRGWNTHIQPGSETRQNRDHYTLQPSPEIKTVDNQHPPGRGGNYRAQGKHLLQNLADTSSAVFMHEVTDLRRSLEELKPLQYPPSQAGAGYNRMTRSSSDQSLHIHHDRGQGQSIGDFIDTLASSYVTSQFDLRPFHNDEQF